MKGDVLVSLDAVSRSHGSRPLFEEVTLGLLEGDRVGLIGPNGSGKSTLLRILAGDEEPDQGRRAARRGITIGYVPQAPVFPGESEAGDVVAAGLAGTAAAGDPADLSRRVAVALGKTGFTDPAVAVATLSGGWKKRLAIAVALAREPDLLLLDEPTNHLDLDSILWLERFLLGESRAYLVVTHDRYFLEATARRVIELDRRYPRGTFVCDGDYAEFIERRDAYLASAADQRESLRNRARSELEWLRRGAKARTRKAAARVAEAERLQADLKTADERARVEVAGIALAHSERRSKKLLEAIEAGKAFAGRPVIAGVTLRVRAGDRVGLLGGNGTGKTTLLRLLAGTVEPDQGRIERAPALRVVTFEQHREALDPRTSLRRALAPSGDAVIFGDRSVHVASWAARFLFRADQLDLPISQLSGGERARVDLARLLLEPADLLLLDEPTNDLDIPTLEALEESLLEFKGGLVLVSHDRLLIDRVSTRILALDGHGRALPFADTAQWEAARAQEAEAEEEAAAGPDAAVEKDAGRGRDRPAAPAGLKRLTYLERKEWDGMEAAIESAEAALAALRVRAEDPTIASDARALEESHAALERAQADVERLYARWAELEKKQLG